MMKKLNLILYALKIIGENKGLTYDSERGAAFELPGLRFYIPDHNMQKWYTVWRVTSPRGFSVSCNQQQTHGR